MQNFQFILPMIADSFILIELLRGIFLPFQ